MPPKGFKSVSIKDATHAILDGMATGFKISIADVIDKLLEHWKNTEGK